MAGGNPKGSTSLKPSPSSSNRKSRWESGKNPSSDNKSGKTPSSDNKLPKPKDDPSSGPSKPSPNQIPQFPQPNPGLLPPPGPHNDPAGLPFPDPANLGPPPPAYGFHMLEKRTIALADGHIRHYFALPPDYQDLPPHHHRLRGGEEMFGRNGPHNDYWNSLGLDGRGPGGPMQPPPEAMLKRKFGDGDERERQRQHVLQYGNPNGFPSGPGMAGTSSGFPLDDMRASKHMRVGGEYDLAAGRGMPGAGAGAGAGAGVGAFHDVDQQALKKAFLRFVKLIYENSAQKANYLENGKHGPLQCIACGRASKDFPDMHGLITHAYGSHSADSHVDHLGLHKALCVLMGWNYTKVPDNSKVYQSLSANEAEANQEDLVLWPPLVIIHNTNTGKGKDGRMEGMGNKVMDNKLKDLGFGGGKAKSLYGKDGHQGITLVKFAPDQSGLKEAVRLAEYFEDDYHGRKGWARAQSSQSGRDDDSNPNLVKVDEKTREKQRILYGYLAIAIDLEKVDFDTRKKMTIESKRELKP